MPTRTYTDQIGEKVTIHYPPQRIVSLVPSQTELLAYLGLEQQVIGITKFCIHPEDWRKTKTIIGGTKNFQIESIQLLKPDLIIANKEENDKEGIEQLKKLYPVWTSDITTLQDGTAMIFEIGKITNTELNVEALIHEIESRFRALVELPPLRTLYLIWRKPWMGAGANTFIHQMITHSGLCNCLVERHRYPELTEDEMRLLNPELVLLSSEPYPFQQKHIEEVQTLLPNARIFLVDGELFSWYGPRLLYFPEYVKTLRQQIV